MSALLAITRPVRRAGDVTPASPASTPATTPATAPTTDPLHAAITTLNNDVRAWRGVSLALGVASVWLGWRAWHESRRYQRALSDAARSREARKAALKTLAE